MFVDHVSFSYDSNFCQILISPHVQTASKQKVKMDEQDIQHKHADHILLPVTAAMSHNGVERPAMHWSFEMAAGAHSDQNLHEFIEQTGRRSFGIFFYTSISGDVVFLFLRQTPLLGLTKLFTSVISYQLGGRRVGFKFD